MSDENTKKFTIFYMDGTKEVIYGDSSVYEDRFVIIYVLTGEAETYEIVIPWLQIKKLVEV